MSENPSLKLTCGSCGVSNEIDLPAVQEGARAEADKLTDAAIAARYRAAFRRMILVALPQSLTRLPLARIDALSDAEAIGAGREVLTLMLSPP